MGWRRKICANPTDLGQTAVKPMFFQHLRPKPGTTHHIIHCQWMGAKAQVGGGRQRLFIERDQILVHALLQFTNKRRAQRFDAATTQRGKEPPLQEKEPPIVLWIRIQ